MGWRGLFQSGPGLRGHHTAYFIYPVSLLSGQEKAPNEKMDFSFIQGTQFTLKKNKNTPALARAAQLIGASTVHGRWWV